MSKFRLKLAITVCTPSVTVTPSVRLLVIDEVSQLTAKLIDDLDKKLRLITGVRKPFGGLHVILCGDFVQLPPVSASPLYVTPGHMFSSDDWRFATHVVTRNKLRRCINFEQAQRWAHVRSTAADFRGT